MVTGEAIALKLSGSDGIAVWAEVRWGKVMESQSHFMTCCGKNISSSHLCNNFSTASWTFYPVQMNRVNSPAAASNSLNYHVSRVAFIFLMSLIT